MEEQYKGHVIRVTTEKVKGAYPWKPICRILDGASREFIKQLDWQVGYDRPDQAEKVGISRKNGLMQGSLISKPLSLDSWQPTPRVTTMKDKTRFTDWADSLRSEEAVKAGLRSGPLVISTGL